MTAIEDRVEADLAVGLGAELIAELETLIGRHPGYERLWGQLMTALYRAGRQADALSTYQRARAALVEVSGVEPSPALQAMQRHVPDQDPGLLPAPAPVTAAPPDPADAARPAQLPPPIAAFSGRTGELAVLDALPEAARQGMPIAVIAGVAGVGKTALAVHWAYRVRDRFVDGQLYVNLRGHAPTAPVRPVEALAGFLPALGVRTDQVPADVDRAAALYRTPLADRRMLVVLDDARSAEQVRPLLPGSPGSVVVVTSRYGLGGLVARDGAVHVALDVLTPDEAYALLRRMLGRRRVDADPEAAGELARLCGHLPLALRIAAANLTLHPELTVADHVAELAADDRLSRLRVDGDEETAVRVAFDLSYAALPAEASRLLRLLGLVPGPDFGVELAASSTGTRSSPRASPPRGPPATSPASPPPSSAWPIRTGCRAATRPRSSTTPGRRRWPGTAAGTQAKGSSSPTSVWRTSGSGSWPRPSRCQQAARARDPDRRTRQRRGVAGQPGAARPVLGQPRSGRRPPPACGRYTGRSVRARTRRSTWPTSARRTSCWAGSTTRTTTCTAR